MHTDIDVVVVGGGPAGATAAERLARTGVSVVLLDRSGRIKPCGGAIPSRLIDEFAVPETLVRARISVTRFIPPSARAVDMEIESGYLAVVDRDAFDEHLRVRAAEAGALRVEGIFTALMRDGNGNAIVHYCNDKGEATFRARMVIGADGARSVVARQALRAPNVKTVLAYQEIIDAPDDNPAFDGARCDLYYGGNISPDFYAWVMPRGDRASVGVSTAQRGLSLRQAVRDLRAATGLAGLPTHRTEGAPVPLEPLRRWDNGRDVVVIGDAAGVVAPCWGEGIYYAMASGAIAGEEVARALATGRARPLGDIRRRFMKMHGSAFALLGLMQRFSYGSDRQRERFVSMCADPQVRHIALDAYFHKRLLGRGWVAYVRVVARDFIAALVRTVRPLKDTKRA